MENKINIGLLGAGRIAGHHIKAIKKVKGLNLIAISDLIKSKRKFYGTKFKINTYKHYFEMLKTEKNIDLVVVMSPSGMHFEHSLNIIRKFKKNVVIEKPPCMNPSQITSLYREAKKNNKKIFPVFQNRNNKCILKLKDLINKKNLGDIRLINLTLRWCRTQRYYDLSTWRGTFSHDGGALTNQGIHYIDLLRHLFGEIRTVKSKMKTFGAKIEVEDSVVGTLEFNSGALGTLEVTTSARPNDYGAIISVVGSKGYAKISGLAANILEEYSLNKKFCKKYSERIPDAYGYGHFKMYRDIKLDLEKSKKYPIQPQDCINTIKLLNSFYVSDEKNKPVNVLKSRDSNRLGKKNEKISKLYR